MFFHFQADVPAIFEFLAKALINISPKKNNKTYANQYINDPIHNEFFFLPCLFILGVNVNSLADL